MTKLDRNILETLRRDFMLAAEALLVYPEGSLEHIRAEYAATNISRTVYTLFGAKAAEHLSAEAVGRRSTVSTFENL